MRIQIHLATLRVIPGMLAILGLISPSLAEAPRSVFERYDNSGVLVFARDVADSGPRRAAANAEHMAYIDTIIDRILVAGPKYDAEGLRIVGSVYVLAVQDEAEARALVEADPFHAAGVWASVEYFPFLPAAGDWIQGVIW
ncbi:MAG: hypothetical protein JJU27_12610 [Gammaproteobacteria bacterium]|nr:hypothetical protein [Gammaproteobacteria bacterium]